MIIFDCSICGKIYKVNDNMVGRTAKCQQCGEKITVPSQIPSAEPNPFSVPIPPVQQTVPVPPITSAPLPTPKELFCTNCGNSVAEQAVACMSCGARPTGHKKFCRQCGVGLNPEQVICIKCGVALTGSFGAGVESVMGAFSNMGRSLATGAVNQNRSFMPVIPPLLMVLLFFSPQLIVNVPNYINESLFGAPHYRFQDYEALTIWGWNSWFGIIMLVLGCLILVGTVAEYCLPNINKLPRQLYSGLYGVAALCLFTGLFFGCTSGHGIWKSAPILGTVPLNEAIEGINKIADSTKAYTSHAFYVKVFPATAILILSVIVVGFRQSLFQFSGVLPDPKKTFNNYYKILWICLAIGLPLDSLGNAIVGFYRPAIQQALEQRAKLFEKNPFLSSSSPEMQVQARHRLIEAGAIKKDVIDDPPRSLMIAGYLSLFGNLVLICTAIFCCRLLYRFWKLIPTDIARTTPGKAVGFLFIPIFNFYWIFVAFRGLGKNMNETLRRYGIQYQVNEGLGGIFCILAIFSCILPGIFTWILYWVPYISFLGILVNLAVAIVLVFFFMSVKKAAIALLKQDKKGSENGGFLKSNLRQSATSADKKLRGSS